MVSLAYGLLLTSPVSPSAITTNNNTPFPSSKLIVGAGWISRRYGPPRNQWGDILPTIWADDGNQYTLIDDGGADIPLKGGLWRNSVARIGGAPPKIRFTHVGDPDDPPPATFSQITANPDVWVGPLGPFYSSGLVVVDTFFFATQQENWDWLENGPFAGLAGIAYSTDQGASWTSANEPFPAPLGNLSWVIRGEGGFYPDGYVYAIASEREFNASTLLLGRAPARVAAIAEPSQWQWASGWTHGLGSQPVFSSALSAAVPIISWPSHITYPQMAYDSPIHRYLLTFTYSYADSPPGIWQNGSELVMLEAPHPWGPFSFVAREPFFGPSNGYDPGFPIAWISHDGRDLWMKWAANFDGCAPILDCAGAYGFNFRRLHLMLAGDRPQTRSKHNQHSA